MGDCNFKIINKESSTDEEKIKLYSCLGEMEMALPLSFNNNIHLTPFDAITFNRFRNDSSLNTVYIKSFAEIL